MAQILHGLKLKTISYKQKQAARLYLMKIDCVIQDRYYEDLMR